jgi:DNA-binding response OmpR family regulator
MRSNYSILVIDDDSAIRETLRIILKPYYDIYTASDGLEALKIMQEHKIHFITLDLNMPKLSGIATLREIRKINTAVPVVMITGYATQEDKKQALLYGAKAFLPKPFDTKELIRVIDGILESPIEGETASCRTHGHPQEHEKRGPFPGSLKTDPLPV